MKDRSILELAEACMVKQALQKFPWPVDWRPGRKSRELPLSIESGKIPSQDAETERPAQQPSRQRRIYNGVSDVLERISPFYGIGKAIINNSPVSNRRPHNCGYSTRS